MRAATFVQVVQEFFKSFIVCFILLVIAPLMKLNAIFTLGYIIQNHSTQYSHVYYVCHVRSQELEMENHLRSSYSHMPVPTVYLKHTPGKLMFVPAGNWSTCQISVVS